jgi:hypothetical protein
VSAYSLTATASAASSHLVNASAISFILILWVNTKGSTELPGVVEYRCEDPVYQLEFTVTR